MNRIVAAALVALGLVPVTQATVIFDSTGAGGAGSTVVLNQSHTSYQSFSTGSSSGELTSLSVFLNASSPSDGFSTLIALYANNANSPAMSIVSLGSVPDSLFSGGSELVNVNLTANPLLASNMRYWIGLVSSSPSGSSGWGLSSSPASLFGTGVQGEFLDVQGGGVITVSQVPDVFVMQVGVTAEATPEPATMVPVASALLCAAFWGVRKRRSIR
jgi:hypothetical protein